MGAAMYIDFVIRGPYFSKAAQFFKHYFAAIMLQMKKHCTEFIQLNKCCYAEAHDDLNCEYTLASRCTPP